MPTKFSDLNFELNFITSIQVQKIYDEIGFKFLAQRFYAGKNETQLPKYFPHVMREILFDYQVDILCGDTI